MFSDFCSWIINILKAQETALWHLLSPLTEGFSSTFHCKIEKHCQIYILENGPRILLQELWNKNHILLQKFWTGKKLWLFK